MYVVLSVITSVLAVTFLGAGLMKVGQSRGKLAASGMGWADDFAPGAIKVIGGLDGLILPAVLGVAPVLIPVSALGLAGLMLGAAIVHGRRGEARFVIVNLVLLALAAVVAWGWFSPCPFAF